ncbi:MAG: hypothetical protein ACM3VS_03675 [Candidatus Dadabacteria bacterium]
MKNPALKTIFWTWLLCFPLAAIVAFVYRFPIPFSEYESGISAVPKALGAVIFYTIMGGFIVIPILGWVAYLLGNQMGNADDKEQRKWQFIFSLVFALSSIILMSVLDKIIGPW